MDVSEAVDSRISCRWFLDRPVDPGLVRKLIASAARAASGGNLQPWHVYALTGAALAELKRQVTASIADRDPRQVDAEYPIYPKSMWEPYQSRRDHHGVQLYGALNIDRNDAAARLNQFKRNYEFFNAPVALFIAVDRRWSRSVGRSRRLYSRADVFGTRPRARHLRPGILGAHAWHRRAVREHAGGADAVLRGLDRLWRPYSSGEQFPLAARGAGGVLQIFWI
jgi:nitroreductase